MAFYSHRAFPSFCSPSLTKWIKYSVFAQRHLWGIIPFFFLLPLGIKHIGGPVPDTKTKPCCWLCCLSCPEEGVGAEAFPALGRDIPSPGEVCAHSQSLFLPGCARSSTAVLAAALVTEPILSSFTDSHSSLLPNQLLEQIFLSVLYSPWISTF